MSTADRDSPRPTSLNQRIRQTEQQLAGRQRSIGLRAAALGRGVREKLSSRTALLVAAGTGFAIGQFSKRKNAKAHFDSGPPSARTSIFATLMDAFALASTVMAFLPVIRRAPVRDTEAAGETP
jgi:hypothetical protein